MAEVSAGTAPAGVERRLTAILAADMVGEHGADDRAGRGLRTTARSVA